MPPMPARLSQWLLLVAGISAGLLWLWAVFWQFNFHYPYVIDALNSASVIIGWLPIAIQPARW